MIAQDTIREAGQRTQRVRVGMIGLAAVLLLIGLASAIFSTMNHDRQVAATGSARPDVVSAMVSGNASDSRDGAAKEPLAELGVAPSAATDNVQDPVLAPVPAKRAPVAR